MAEGEMLKGVLLPLIPILAKSRENPVKSSVRIFRAQGMFHPSLGVLWISRDLGGGNSCKNPFFFPFLGSCSSWMLFHALNTQMALEKTFGIIFLNLPYGKRAGIPIAFNLGGWNIPSSFSSLFASISLD